MSGSKPHSEIIMEDPLPDITFLEEPVPLPEQRWPAGTVPLVSIGCITFRHEKFIREAIEGFLMQKTTFPVEIVIHDDASPDGTADIIREYEEKYPQLIRPICQTENQYSQGKRPSRIMKRFVKGKYIAACEGDDYWIDPLKLQKQVDFLEKNPEYGLVHGDAHKYFQKTGAWGRHANKNKINTTEPANKEELFYGIINFRYKIRTATVLYRLDLLRNLTANRKVFPMGDTPMWLELSRLTRFHYIDEPLAVYRVQRNSLSKSTDKKRYFRFKLAMMEMRVYYCNLFGYDVRPDLKSAYNGALLNYFLLDPDYQPEYPLLDPSARVERLWRMAHNPALRPLLKTGMLAMVLFNRLRRKYGAGD